MWVINAEMSSNAISEVINLWSYASDLTSLPQFPCLWTEGDALLSYGMNVKAQSKKYWKNYVLDVKTFPGAKQFNPF